jgi:hypothetical protein
MDLMNMQKKRLKTFTLLIVVGLLFTCAPSTRATIVVISESGDAGITEFLGNNFSDIPIRRGDFADFNTAATPTALVDADLVIIGRSITSAEYDQFDASGYNELTIPVCCLTSYVAREYGNRLGWHISNAGGSESTLGDETTIAPAGVALFGAAGAVDWHDLAVGFGFFVRDFCSSNSGVPASEVAEMPMSNHISRGTAMASGSATPAARLPKAAAM